MNCKKILKDCFKKCIDNNLCGNLIHINDNDIEWFINKEDYSFVALTDFGSYKYHYNFDYNLIDNLNEFASELTEFYITEDRNRNGAVTDE